MLHDSRRGGRADAESQRLQNDDGVVARGITAREEARHRHEAKGKPPCRLPGRGHNEEKRVPEERLAGWNAGKALTESSVPPPTIDKRISPAKLVATLEHSGDVISRNLEFSYRPDVPVSYGEETITETNLLELRRRHLDVVHLRTFSKHQESKIGADWEWYIVGRKRTLKMLVQAKRVQRNGVLKLRHAVGQSGGQQRDLLIEAAQANRMRPMYCIYCTEAQRSLWKQSGPLQTGCLLADARNLPLDTRSLRSIEWACWPWHNLFEPFPRRFILIDYFRPSEEDEEARYALPPQPLRWDVPTIRDLNEDTGGEYDPTGVEDTTPLDLARITVDGTEEIRREDVYDRERQLDEGVQRVVAIDVRSLSFPEYETPS